MERFDISNCKFDFASDLVNIIIFIYDKSGSMCSYVNDICRANKAFKEDFSRFEEKNSVAISKMQFDNSFVATPFNTVSYFDTSYTSGGGTRLYEAIYIGADYVTQYYNELVKRLNIRPRVTFFVFSDGQDSYCDPQDFNKARNAVKELNSIDATTVFVAFGEAIGSGDGESLGFSCTRDINNRKELMSCLGAELSQSCKEQSRSAYSLKSAFFSKADKNSAEDDTAANPITDDDFFDV